MFSIGEFARMGTVSVRTLRHYDEIGLLRPAQVDPETGYRSYSADQLGQLNRIRAGIRDSTAVHPPVHPAGARPSWPS